MIAGADPAAAAGADDDLDAFAANADAADIEGSDVILLAAAAASAVDAAAAADADAAAAAAAAGDDEAVVCTAAAVAASLGSVLSANVQLPAGHE